MKNWKGVSRIAKSGESTAFDLLGLTGQPVEPSCNEQPHSDGFDVGGLLAEIEELGDQSTTPTDSEPNEFIALVLQWLNQSPPYTKEDRKLFNLLLRRVLRMKASRERPTE